MPKKSQLEFEEADIDAARRAASQQIAALHDELHRLMIGEKATVAEAIGLSSEYWGKARRRGSLNLNRLLETLVLLGVQPGTFFGRALPQTTAAGSAETEYLSETPGVAVPGLEDSLGSEK